MEQPTSLASIYQARKKAEGDSSTTVEVLKKQYQDQIERIIHDKNGQVQSITKSYIPSSNEREVRNFKKLEREKSFDEARNAVQSQIEKIFEKAKNNSNKPLSPKLNIIKYGLPTPLTLIRPPIQSYPEEEEYDLENNERHDFQSPEHLRMPVPSSLNQRMLQKSNMSSTSPIEPRSKRSSSVESGILPPPPPPLLISSTSTDNVHFSSPDIIQKESVPEEPEELPPPPLEIVNKSPPRTTTFIKMNGHQRRPSVHQPLHRERHLPKSFSSMSQLDQLKKDKEFIPLIVPPKKRRSSTSSSSSSSTCSCEEVIRKKPVKKPPPRPKPKPFSRRKKNRAPAPVVKPKPPIKKDQDTQDQSVNNVEYLGALPLSEKASDLGSLQVPLKVLYFKYLDKVLKNSNHKKRQQKCFLDIDSNGMKITFPGKDAEFTYNPFPTIAVWAAIRFIHRQKPDAKHNAFAFLPLISDPSDKEKNTLFHDLSIDELVYTQKNVYHPPLFACIMRQHGVSRKLECHGFVCDTKEDAISIAADLFKCLMSSVEIQTKKPKRRNSTVSSKSSSISVVSSRLRKNRSLRQSKRINNSIARRKLQEKESGIKGDIYTKVAMPRSRSFMNVNGQYNLQDLFKELRDKEGIESVDDVLRLVISPHGMSFNKIPPMYRDLLMKLVMSMSKDEIFIRSKNIMMEELKKSKKKKKGFLLGKRKKSTSIKAKDLDKELKKLTIGNPVPIDLDQIQKFPPSKAIDLNLIKKTQERSVFINAKPIQSSSNSSSSSTKKMSSTNNKLSLSNSRRISSGESEYKSCSECGYTSVCGTLCSCSGMEESSSLPSASRKSNSNPSSNCTCKDCDESLSIYCSSCTSVHSDDEEDDEKMSMDSVVDKDWSKKKLSSSSNASSSSSPGKSDELFVNSSTYTEFETEDSHGKTMSSDSLSSSSSSYSSSHCDSLSGEHPQKLHRKSDGSVIYKGPRPAYSESNMQNSLGYLP